MAAPLEQQIQIAQQIVDYERRMGRTYKGEKVTNIVQVDTLSVDVYLDGKYAGTVNGLFASCIIHGRMPTSA